MADLDEKALLPCPFGCSAPIGHRTTDRTVVMVCTECGACGPYEEGSAEDEAVWSRAFVAWNRRALPSVTPASEVVEALRDAKKRFVTIENCIARNLFHQQEKIKDAQSIATDGWVSIDAVLASLAPAQGEREGGAK